MIENTSKTAQDNPLALLADALLGNDGGAGAIERMEARGQQQLVNSDRLPVDTDSIPDTEFRALGFTFGEPDPSDRLFRPATLPEGWRREASDHNMWSYIVDHLGRRRVAIFYKAAFYDRRAFMRLETPVSYLRSCLYDGAAPVLDDEWLTRETADTVLAGIRDEYLSDAERNDRCAAQTGRTDENRQALRQYGAEDRERADKAEALRVKVGGGTDG